MSSFLSISRMISLTVLTIGVEMYIFFVDLPFGPTMLVSYCSARNVNENLLYACKRLSACEVDFTNELARRESHDSSVSRPQNTAYKRIATHRMQRMLHVFSP
jgi:hypothetical protein